MKMEKSETESEGEGQRERGRGRMNLIIPLFYFSCLDFINAYCLLTFTHKYPGKIFSRIKLNLVVCVCIDDFFIITIDACIN